MLTLRQTLYVAGSAGDPLPAVWKSLEDKGTRLLRGQLSLVCAGPGVGKSSFALTYALKSKVPTLYFSADSDAFIQRSRAICMLSGCTMEQAFSANRDRKVNLELEKQLDSIPIRFNLESSPSLQDIGMSLKSYEEVYGRYPELVIIDNVTNVVTSASEEDPFAGLEMLMDVLHKMARDTGAHVMGLHHVTGGYNDSNKIIPLSGVKNQISRVPEMILTMHKASQAFGKGTLRVSTVKNRAGSADPSGSSFVELEFDTERMQIR